MKDVVESSYRLNDLGAVLRSLVEEHEPCEVLEFGVLHGYSAMHMAQGLRTLGRGRLIAYDLWDEYPYHHTTMDAAQRNLDRFELSDYVTLRQGDYYRWLTDPDPFDLLHVDISNDGDVFERTLTVLSPQIRAGATVVLEGGSVQRDQVDWMSECGRRPINALQSELGFRILDGRFPSISIATAS